MTTTTTSRTMHLARRTSVLRFAPGPGAPPDGEYTLRGGVCWPIVVDPADGRMVGFALVAARSVRDGVTYVLAQTEFVCVDHVQDASGRILFAGLSTWLNDGWNSWFCDTYCWHQPWETNRRYLRQVLDSPMIAPKPHFVELDWDDDEDARAAIYEAEAQGRLAYEAQSPLHLALLDYGVALPADRDRFPAVQALTCALFGLEQATPRRVS